VPVAGRVVGDRHVVRRRGDDGREPVDQHVDGQDTVLDGIGQDLGEPAGVTDEADHAPSSSIERCSPWSSTVWTLSADTTRSSDPPPSSRTAESGSYWRSGLPSHTASWASRRAWRSVAQPCMSTTVSASSTARNRSAGWVPRIGQETISRSCAGRLSWIAFAARTIRSTSGFDAALPVTYSISSRPPSLLGGRVLGGPPPGRPGLVAADLALVPAAEGHLAVVPRDGRLGAQRAHLGAEPLGAEALQQRREAPQGLTDS